MRIRSSSTESSEVINMTSLLDVLFILIIFFLVTTTFKQQEDDRRVDLPVDQRNQALANKAGDIVKINIFLTDLSQFPAILEWRPKYFDQPYPAATCVVVNSMVRRELIMEIEAIAILD